MQRYSAVELSRALRLSEGLFITREVGEQAYPLLRRQLEQVPEGEALIVTFPPNQLADGSFLDEAIVRIARELISGEFGNRGLILEGLTTNTVKNANGVIRLQNLDIAILTLTLAGEWGLLGHLDQNLREALELVASHNQITAPEIAEQLGLAPNTASTRLKRLHDLHLVRRIPIQASRGLQFAYSFWTQVSL